MAHSSPSAVSFVNRAPYRVFPAFRSNVGYGSNEASKNEVLDATVLSRAATPGFAQTCVARGYGWSVWSFLSFQCVSHTHVRSHSRLQVSFSCVSKRECFHVCYPVGLIQWSSGLFITTVPERSSLFQDLPWRVLVFTWQVEPFLCFSSFSCLPLCLHFLDDRSQASKSS